MRLLAERDLEVDVLGEVIATKSTTPTYGHQLPAS